MLHARLRPAVAADACMLMHVAMHGLHGRSKPQLTGTLVDQPGLLFISFEIMVQVPGFTHPVTDVYLDEVLGMVGYAPHLGAGSNGAGGRHTARAAHLAPEAQQVIQDAIMQAFLDGSDASFEDLLEVGSSLFSSDHGSACPFVLLASGLDATA